MFFPEKVHLLSDKKIISWKTIFLQINCSSEWHFIWMVIFFVIVQISFPLLINLFTIILKVESQLNISWIRTAIQHKERILINSKSQREYNSPLMFWRVSDNKFIWMWGIKETGYSISSLYLPRSRVKLDGESLQP